MTRSEWIESTLRTALSPRHISVTDESAQHAGHAGAAAGGGHFRVFIVSEAFRGQNLLARHRSVYAALGTAMQRDIHALALDTLTPEEWQRSAGS